MIALLPCGISIRFAIHTHPGLDSSHCASQANFYGCLADPTIPIMPASPAAFLTILVGLVSLISAVGRVRSSAIFAHINVLLTAGGDFWWCLLGKKKKRYWNTLLSLVLPVGRRVMLFLREVLSYHDCLCEGSVMLLPRWVLCIFAVWRIFSKGEWGGLSWPIQVSWSFRVGSQPFLSWWSCRKCPLYDSSWSDHSGCKDEHQETKFINRLMMCQK